MVSINTGMAGYVWEIADAVSLPSATEAWSVDDWKQAEQLIADHQIEMFARPSTAPGMGPEDGGKPGANPRGLAFKDRFFARDKHIFAAIGANQCAKTTVVGGLMFCGWVRDHAQDGDEYWVVAQRNEDLRNIPAKTLWQYLPQSMFPDGIKYHPRLGFGSIQTLKLKLPGARGYCEVWFRSEEMELNIFESARLNGVWWTECKREAIFDALQPRLVARDGFLIMDYVPREAWHRMRIQRVNHPHIEHQRFSMMSNAHNLAPGAIKKIRDTITPEEARVRIDGEDGGSEGVVVKEFAAREYNPDNVMAVVHLIANTPIPRCWPAAVYIDVGKYTAAPLIVVGSDGLTRVMDEVYTLGLNVEENCNQIKQMLARYGRWIFPIVGKGATEERREAFKKKLLAKLIINEPLAAPLWDIPGDIPGVRVFKMDPSAWAFTSANQITIGDQYKTQGLPVVGWKRTQTQAGGEEAMLNKLRVQFMHRGILVCERCEAMTIELQTWRHKLDRDGKVDPGDRYEGANHCIDALKAFVADGLPYEEPTLEILDVGEDW